METEIGCVLCAQCTFETIINRIQLNVTTEISSASERCTSERWGRLQQYRLECMHLVFTKRIEKDQRAHSTELTMKMKKSFTYVRSHHSCTHSLFLAQYWISKWERRRRGRKKWNYCLIFQAFWRHPICIWDYTGMNINQWDNFQWGCSCSVLRLFQG